MIVEMYIGLLLLLSFIVIFLVNKLIATLFNISNKNKGKHDGVIYNPLTKQLEGNGSDIDVF